MFPMKKDRYIIWINMQNFFQKNAYPTIFSRKNCDSAIKTTDRLS